MVSWHSFCWRASRNLSWSSPSINLQQCQTRIKSRLQSRTITTDTGNSNFDVSRIRNIGIIAHIDAGKTTTTERMLYYSGHTRRIGNVDEGSTVTDFLPAEKARGITIQSAAITFDWPPTAHDKSKNDGLGVTSAATITHHINLIDTPGHADFTFEVRRSLRVLDGAICILDGVAGVEAQTEQVWRQAGEWSIPRIAYINKLDRNGALFGRTVKEIGAKLGGWPAVCQIPWWQDGKGQFCGIGDAVHLQAMLYEAGSDGRSIQLFTLDELDQRQPQFASELRKARTALVELLSDHDEELVEAFLEAEEDHLAITPQTLWTSMRRCLLSEPSKIIPIFAGSSFRNIGVQPLLDAVNHLLPSPLERPAPEVSFDGQKHRLEDIASGRIAHTGSKTISDGNQELSTRKNMSLSTLKGCALAFKVVNDPRKGTLVYFRVYSGLIERNDLIFNTNLQVAERAATLLRMYASDSIPIQAVSAGQIGVIAGSKHARTGDTLICHAANKASPPERFRKLQLRPIRVPPPVFFASLEPSSLREEKDMHDKLALLLREDPSLHVTQDPDTGQTLLSGMGELHLEIARDRLVGDLKANARMGKIAIGYRETVTQPSLEVTKIFDSDKSNVRGKAGCTVKVGPVDASLPDVAKDNNSRTHEHDGNIVIVQTPTLDGAGHCKTDNGVSLPDHLDLVGLRHAFVNGATAALSRGPSHSLPVHGVQVVLTLRPEEHLFGSETSYTSLTTAARLATTAALRCAADAGASALMEPVMDVDISIDETSLGTVVQDLSSNRGGHVVNLGDDTETTTSTTQELLGVDVNKIYIPPDPFGSGDMERLGQHINIARTIKAKVPLKEMVGYLKHLRSMTAGRGTFVMSVDQFVKVSGQREKTLIAELRGSE